MNNFYVYCHKLFDGRRYIGITKQNPSRRWRNGEGYKVRNNNSYFYNAIKEYGWNSFEHIILFTNLSKEQAINKEKELIKKYNTQDRNKGFNLTAGGEGIFNPSEETRKKIGEKSKIINLGRKHTEETKIKISKANRGINNPQYKKQKTKKQLEAIQKIGKRNKTEIQKQKMSKSAKKRKILCIETNEIFNSMKEASEIKNICYTSLTCCVYGRNKTAGGYHWKSVE